MRVTLLGFQSVLRVSTEQVGARAEREEVNRRVGVGERTF
jgi:hypothetical protein